MPLIVNEKIGGKYILGVWKIEEPPELLHRQSLLTDNEEKHYQTLQSPLRKKQWLSYHAIISVLIGKEGNELAYNNWGKPYLTNRSHFLSVSHSGDYSAVILSRNHLVGIDIEKVGERIERVKGMFLSEDELVRIGSAHRTEKLLVYWGAKEAVFKIFGNPELLCIQDITIEPFDYLCSGECSLRATVMVAGKKEKFSASYRRIDDYMLVYAYDFLITKSPSWG